MMANGATVRCLTRATRSAISAASRMWAPNEPSQLAPAIAEVRAVDRPGHVRVLVAQQVTRLLGVVAVHRRAVSVDHLVALLERHSVTVAAQGARSLSRPIGEVLLAKARELRCDLLVMGGYGHSPLREHLFGGPTHFVLEHMDLPVLLSH